MEKKLNIWAHIKWLWDFNPILWLLAFSVLITALAGLIFGGLTAFITGFSLTMMWVCIIVICDIYDKCGNEIKSYVRKWWAKKPK